MKLAELAIRRPVLATMVIVLPILLGAVAYPRIAVEQLPSIELPIVTVVASYPGADPSAVEANVARPIEDALASMSGIRTLRSISLSGLTQVVVELELGSDVDRAVQDIRDRLAQIRGLPPELDAPRVARLDLAAAPIVSLALSGALPPRELTQLAEDIVVPRLSRLAGVGQIDVLGGQSRAIHVVLDPARLAAHGATPGDVAAALVSQNLELPAGRIASGAPGRELAVTTRGAFTSLDELAGAPLPRTAGAAAIRIGDVASIEDTARAPQSYASIDAAPALALVIQKAAGANLVDVARAIRAQVAALEPVLAARGVRLVVTDDASPFVERLLRGVEIDLALGAILAVAIIFGFLRDGRATLISALALPSSVIATVWFLELFGFSFNQMTLLALSLSIGLLIDDAIVVIENIHRHLARGVPALRAAAEGTAEIGLAVLATTGSIVAVFVPVAFMHGVVGAFFFQFGVTVSVAVIVSMVVSFTLTPLLSARLLRVAHHRGRIALAIERALAAIDRGYGRTLAAALRHRARTLAIAACVLAGSVVLVTRVDTELLPADDRAAFTLAIALPPGTALAATRDVAEALAADLRAHAPGVTSTLVTIGRGSGAVDRAQIQVQLVAPSARGFSQRAAMAWVRARYAPLAAPGLQLTLGELGTIGGGDSRPIQLQLRGRDPGALAASAASVLAELRALPGFVDLGSSDRGGNPQLALIPDRAAAAQLGVPIAAIARTVHALIGRGKVTEYKAGVQLVDVRLRLADHAEAELPALADLMVRAESGELVPLASLVRLDTGPGPAEIARQSRQRQITLFAGLDGIALGDATRLVDSVVARVLPPGSEIEAELSGQSQLMTESFGALIAALLFAIALVYMILAAQFESFVHPLTIMMSLPLAIAGAFGGLALADQPLGIFGMIGLIMLMGLVTKNAILLVDLAQQYRARGAAISDALLAAGPVRLRPILMTTAAMILGMLPVALALGEGGAGRAPMAVVVIGGLITSTILTLVVVPVVYSLVESLVARGPRSSS